MPLCFRIRGPAAAAAKASAAAGGKVVKIHIHSSSKRKSSQNMPKIILWVSEVTLGIFGVQFGGFSVLHCHCVFLSGDQQQQQQKPLHHLAKLIMGFRSYVRHFRGAIWGLLRPSLPLCFPIRGPAAAAASAAAGGKSLYSSSKKKKPQKWVSEVTLGIFMSAILGLLRPSLPWCFRYPGTSSSSKSFCRSRRKR